MSMDWYFSAAYNASGRRRPSRLSEGTPLRLVIEGVDPNLVGGEAISVKGVHITSNILTNI